MLHPFNNSTVDKSYELLRKDMLLNQPLLFPDGKVRGRGGRLPDVLDERSIMLHGHTISNDSAFPDGQRPTVSEALSAGDGVVSEYFVALPKNSYPRSWYAGEPKYNHESGAVVPLPHFVGGVYEFIDNMNSSRVTNFKDSGVWFVFQALRNETGRAHV